MIDNPITLNIAGNKMLSQTMLAEQGYRVPRLMRFNFQEVGQAVDFMRELGKPVVVKPAFGTGAGRGITTKIDNERALRRAAHRALAYSNEVLIEEQVDGRSFRLLFLEGELVDAIRRDPPSLIGDGRSTVSQLIEAENHRRLHDRPVRALNPLTIDTECRLKLAQQGLTVNAVPAAGQRFLVKDVVNQNAMEDNHVVSGQVHPDFLKMGRSIYRGFRIDLLGLDLIASDIERPLRESRGVINELNTTPGLHHHYLVADVSRGPNVGMVLLDHLLQSTVAHWAHG